MKSVILIPILVIVIISSSYLAYNSIVNLQRLDKEKQEAIPYFEDTIMASLETCELSEDPKIIARGADEVAEVLKVCKNNLQFAVDMCDFYGNPPACSDPRIKKYLP